MDSLLLAAAMFYLYSLTFILAICRCIHEDSRSSAAQSLTPHYLFCKGKASQLNHCRSDIIWVMNHDNGISICLVLVQIYKTHFGETFITGI